MQKPTIKDKFHKIFSPNHCIPKNLKSYTTTKNYTCSDSLNSILAIGFEEGHVEIYKLSNREEVEVDKVMENRQAKNGQNPFDKNATKSTKNFQCQVNCLSIQIDIKQKISRELHINLIAKLQVSISALRLYPTMHFSCLSETSIFRCGS